MSARPLSAPAETIEHLLARLTDAAYRVALDQGIQGPFLDFELGLWSALRRVLEVDSPAPAGSGPGSTLFLSHH
jgi:hypothetical protein